MRTIKELKRLSLLKWDYLVENPKTDISKLREIIPELKNEIAGCSFCTSYYSSDCKGCPVRIENPEKEKYPYMAPMLTCNDTFHPFITFVVNRSTENAKAVRDLIQSIPEEETNV